MEWRFESVLTTAKVLARTSLLALDRALAGYLIADVVDLAAPLDSSDNRTVCPVWEGVLRIVSGRYQRKQKSYPAPQHVPSGWVDIQ